MSLEGSLQYERMIQPAIPTNDRKFLLKLLQLETATHPPQASVVSLTLTAEAGHQPKVQLGLFAPQALEPSRLDVTLARLKAIVGADRVGSPVLMDTHRPGYFEVQRFSVPSHLPQNLQTSRCTSLRRLRPPQPLRMQTDAGRPKAFRDGTAHFQVSVAYGPWQSSGCWWAVDRWDFEEWDILATSCSGESITCLVLHDHLNRDWLLDAYYD